jgi:hypothetical protein
MMSIRPAFSLWPTYNDRLREAVGRLTPEQVRLAPEEGRWPIWAVVGHLACQRVFGLCDFAGEPGKEATPFPNAAFNCPGDDDLANVLECDQLVDALESTFGIVERCLDTWTIESLSEVIARSWPNGETRRQTRGRILQRSLAHDISHIAEVNETLGKFGLQRVDLWE